MNFADACKEEPTHPLCRILERGDPESMTDYSTIREIGWFCLNRPEHYHPLYDPHLRGWGQPGYVSRNGRIYDALCMGRDQTAVGRLSQCVSERGIKVSARKFVRVKQGDAYWATHAITGEPFVHTFWYDRDDAQATTNLERLEYALSACNVRPEGDGLVPLYPGGRDGFNRFWADMPDDLRANCYECAKTRCSVSDWSPWSGCSKPCGGGERKRTREVTQMIKGRESSCPRLSETEACNTEPCPVDCQVSPWSAWSECTKECDGGETTRTREVITSPQHGGAPCPSLSETAACKTQPCPVDCRVSDWGAWSACSRTCGGGQITRTRKVLTSPQHGGAPCPSVYETAACNTQPCPVECRISAWSAWSPCALDRSSGAPTQTRTRTVVAPAVHGGGCSYPLSETRSCQLPTWGDGLPQPATPWKPGPSLPASHYWEFPEGF